MTPRIEFAPERRLVGKRIIMSLINNRTGELWRSFMQQRKEINNVIGRILYSVEIYNPFYFQQFNPDEEFEKWAAVEVSEINHLPQKMETIILPAGLHAVFLYKGKASEASAMFEYIFSTWLPTSDYVLDHRPHFELMGDKYKSEDPVSEEEFWIPVRHKG